MRRLLFLKRIVFLLFITTFYLYAGTASAREFPVSALFSIRQLILEKGYPQISEKQLLEKTCKRIGVADLCKSWESLFANAGTLGEERIGRSIVESFEDPYSILFSPSEAREFTGQLQGKAVGVGITIFPKNGKFIIGGVLPDSPAWKQGVESGDELISVNGVKLEGEPLANILRLLSGAPGFAVYLEVARGALKVNLSLTRIILPYKMVEVKFYNDVGVIKINGFGHGVSNEVRNWLNIFKSQGIKKCILDLRDNPGGLFTEAIRVADFFLPQGVVISYKDTREGTAKYAATGIQIWRDDLAVLVDRGTASGSELVASALKDHRRALVLGTLSAGKGSVQTLIPIGNGWFLDLTTAHYRSPYGKEIHKIGIEPDIVLKEKYFPLGSIRISKDVDEILGRSLEFMKKYKRQDDL